MGTSTQEAEIQARIKEWMENQGCIVVKQTTLMSYGKSGFPDLAIFMHKERAWFLEVKVPGKIPDNRQFYWIDRLRRYGFQADVVSSLGEAQELYQKKYASGGRPPGMTFRVSRKPKVKNVKKTKGGK